jgi:CheY-like chemotaxis protein
MARILHVEDDKFWRSLVGGRLGDHHIDSVASLKEAIELLDSESPYNLALVDLNLLTDSDRQGGELLDLLRMRYPSTRRIVITGSPPAGAVRKNVFERYDVEEIIIKRDLDIPDLRRVVEEAIAQGPDGPSQSVRLSRSILRQRFRDWQRVERDQLTNERRAAEEHLYDAARVSEQSRERAQTAVDQARQKERQFEDLCRRLRIAIGEINSEYAMNVAMEALEAAEEQFGERSDKGDH